MQQVIQPPDSIWEALWPAIATVLTPELIGAFAITIAVVHSIKLVTPVFMPHVVGSKTLWRAYTSSLSVLVGALAGLILWVGAYAEWPAIPVVAFGTSLIWRLLIAVLPKRIGLALMTDTDRKWTGG